MPVPVLAGPEYLRRVHRERWGNMLAVLFECRNSESPEMIERVIVPVVVPQVVNIRLERPRTPPRVVRDSQCPSQRSPGQSVDRCDSAPELRPRLQRGFRGEIFDERCADDLVS